MLGIFKDGEETFLEMYKVIDSAGRSRRRVKYLCSRGHRVDQLLDTIKQGGRCRECQYLDMSEKFRTPTEEVERMLKSIGLELLDDEFINHTTPVRYRCECGNESKSYLRHLLNGIRCGCKVRSGEDNPSWNPNKSDEEREKTRRMPEYRNWSSAVYERDDYTCQYCGYREGKLHAHHIFPYSTHPHRRGDISNGITLCRTCHINFHWIYGYKNAEAHDFYEYMGW